MTKIEYRPDIDGLRALAVLSVILYHAGLESLSGGYIGVDIFFVISGYLITSIIYSELNRSVFSFKLFWMRRARRILPAALTMVLTCLIVFAFLYPETLYEDFLKSLVSQSIFSANIYFWQTSGYFESAAELKPLLHTWSLSVEEQFYFIFPFLLWTLHKFRKTLTLIILIIGCASSLALSILGTFDYPDASFYLLPTRAWELGAGAALAIYLTTNEPKHHWPKELASVIGLVSVIFPMFVFTKDTSFPSYNALAPVLGTCLLIWSSSNGKTFIGRIFSGKYFVYIGLISYSMYLWHWPIIVAVNWVYAPEHNMAFTVLILGLTFFAAYVSYKFIESPLRKNKAIFTNKIVAVTSCLASIALIAIGIFLIDRGNSLLVDPTGKISNYYNQAISSEENRGQCSDLIYINKEKVSCSINENNYGTPPDIYVWGDSHAGALLPAISDISKQGNLNIKFAIHNGCQPVAGMRRVDSNFMCKEFNDKVLNEITEEKPKVLLLIGSFVENISVGKLRAVQSELSVSSVHAYPEFEHQFNDTINFIKKSNPGTKIIVFTEPPRFPLNPVNEYLRRKTLKIEGTTSFVSLNEHYRRIGSIYDAIDQANIDSRLDYATFFCPEEYCIDSFNGKSLYKDASHISNYGAHVLSPLIYNDLLAHLSD